MIKENLVTNHHVCLINSCLFFFYIRVKDVHTEALKMKISKSNTPDEMYYLCHIFYMPVWVTASEHIDIVWGRKKEKKLAR